jgi:putative transposase
MSQFRRKNIRLPATEYIGRKWYFLTMVAEGRRERFSNPRFVAENLSLLAARAACCHFDIWAYCFMPDHFHILTSGTQEDSQLLQLAGGFKQGSACAFKRLTGEGLWQKKFYDHILRKDDCWERVACYIWLNPVRKALCKRAEDWPYSGSFMMDWRKLLAVGVDPWVPPWKRDAK